VILNGTDTLTITLTNTSSNALPLDNSFITIALPAGLGLVSGSLTLPVGALGAGQSTTFTLTVTGTALGPQTVTVTVTSPDTNPNSNSGSATITVITTPTPPPPPVTTQYYAVGADAGGGPEVVVYNAATNAVVVAFFAFTPTFTGGVRVAVADINGDGTTDIIAAAGPGGGPQVIVVDGTKLNQLQPNGQIANAALLSSFYAFTPTFTGGVRVAVGDVNGDGVLDIITGAGPGGGPQVTVFNGVNLTSLQNFYAFPAFFTGGVFVASGDVNGDQLADVIVGAGAGGGPQVNIYNGAGNGTLLSSFFDPRLGGVTDVLLGLSAPGVRVATTVAQGKTEILTGAGAGLPPLVDIYDGSTLALLDSFFALPAAFPGGVFIGG